MPGEWWTKSWGIVEGCTPVSRGCDHCWARGMLKRFGKNPHEVRTFLDRLDTPLHWRKPQRVFVAPRGDLFHEDVPEDFIWRVYETMGSAPGSHHIYLLLTKRPERMARVLHAPDDSGYPVRGTWWRWPPPNVYLGVSVEDQETADERIPILLETPAAKRFVSAEPLLEELNLGAAKALPIYQEASRVKVHYDLTGKQPPLERAGRGWVRYDDPIWGKIDWLVTAPESGPARRYCDLDWVRSLRDQCAAANVPFMFKHWYDGNKKVSLPLLDGRRHEEGA